MQTAENIRRKSHELENGVHKKHVERDQKEEELKARNEKLLQGIASYNSRIRELGSGFGFLFNIFQMRSLQAERRRLDQEHEDVAARIESIRAQWVQREKEFNVKQDELLRKWRETTTKASTLQSKIDLLNVTRASLVERTTLERVLFEKYPSPPPQGNDVVCPRCKSGNAASNRFCHICAQRLQPDRPDLEGSIPELAELNHHHRRFSEGMKACQEIIGLLTGLESGLKAFSKSIANMIKTETTYPVGKLSIDVPAQCVQFANSFEQLGKSCQDKTSHPTEFAKLVKSAAQTYSEEKLQAFFERMGKELSVQAKSQWG